MLWISGYRGDLLKIDIDSCLQTISSSSSPSGILSIHLSKDQVIAGCYDQLLRFYTHDNVEAGFVNEATGPIRNIQQWEKYVLTGSDVLHIYDSQSWEHLHSFKKVHKIAKTAIQSLSIHETGNLALVNDGDQIILYDLTKARKAAKWKIQMVNFVSWQNNNE